ncbi:hypothetical protein Vadar_005641 [Vaccinium darrowii]|uniref:Uncharacterized protein n=1 Tax=Vaccinium darrowii TaxID=229202 RepID=A0ACB7XNF0_9ERIC|nr:hypothetical protein Vadar_005641 [Vaccinium darrowii]
MLFLEAEFEGVLDDFGDFTPYLDLYELIPPIDGSDESCSQLILMIHKIEAVGGNSGQLAEMSGGGQRATLMKEFCLWRSSVEVFLQMLGRES